MNSVYVSNTTEPIEQNRTIRKLAPAFGLFLLAPMTAEYLTGYLDSTGNFPVLLFSLLFFSPLYGGAALTIREVTRRTGRGWLTMILLSFAFGVFQAGLVDHSLFNLSYQDIEWWEETAMPTYLPSLGISVYFAMIFIVGHVIWSICAPIAIIETFVPHHRTTPWLGKGGLTVTVLLYFFMSGLIFWGHIEEENFLPSASQLIGAALVVAGFIVAAFYMKQPHHAIVEQAAPTPKRAGIITFAVLSLMTIIEIVVAILGLDAELTIGWFGTGLSMMLYILLAIFVWNWTKYKDWSVLHMLAVAGGAVLAKAWFAFLVEPIGDVPIGYKLLHNVVFLIGSVLLLYSAAHYAAKRGKETR